MNTINMNNNDIQRAKIAGLLKYCAVIYTNGFKNKSLSDFAFNPVLGCMHACVFCYVASLVRFQKKLLATLGIHDPDGDWGKYAFVRAWDPSEFRETLRSAERKPDIKLSRDGNRAIIFSSTTDSYSTISCEDAQVRAKANALLKETVRGALELILRESTLNVRILTRSPLAERDFDLMEKYGSRLLFGMSLPTLNNKLAKVYEPGAPAPTRRLQTLKRARDRGLNVFVAVAPTYPECDRADLLATFTAIKELNPVTVFHEPINVRADNIDRIAKSAAAAGVELNPEVLRTECSWRKYAIGQLHLAESVAAEVGLAERLHLWPDSSLLSATSLKEQTHPEEFRQWVVKWHNRVSEWPTDTQNATTKVQQGHAFTRGKAL